MTVRPMQPADRAALAQFVDLICWDDELVNQEFEAIIGAEWPAGISASPPAVPGPVGRRDEARALWQQPTPLRQQRRGGESAWGRQRSPPWRARDNGGGRDQRSRPPRRFTRQV